MHSFKHAQCGSRQEVCRCGVADGGNATSVSTTRVVVASALHIATVV